MRFVLLGCSALGVAFALSSAHAGGFSRGTADTDILYEDGGFNFRAGAIIAVPTQEFKSAPTIGGDPGLVGTNYLDTYVIPSVAAKFGFGENLACAGTYTDSNGAASSYAVPYGAPGTLSEEFTVGEFGATCAVFFNAGRGRFALLGGGFVERFDYDLEAQPIVFPPATRAPLRVGLESNAYGWRAGLGYEIPEIALRAQLMYRSGTTHDASGDAALGPISGLPAEGAGELPQSVELKVQSGIAPGWLAFGSVKWTDWSVNETLSIVVPALGLESERQYYWRDGWTVTGGVGHAFSEKISGLVSLQWDRGVSTGYDLRTDKWLLAAGASFEDDWGGELRLGGGVSYLTSAEITASDAIERGASVDSGWAGILSASYSVKW